MLTAILITVIVLLVVGLVAILIIWSVAYQRLAKYDNIDDAEVYVENCQKKAAQAKTEAELVSKAIVAEKQKLKKYMEVTGVVKNAAEAKQKADEFERHLARIKREIESVEEIGSLQSAGYYHRKYPHDTPEQLKCKLDGTREELKNMIKEGTACTCDVPWTVDGDTKKGEKMTKEYVRLMLRAFNGESDVAISKVNHSNMSRMSERIGRAWQSINKAGEPHKTSIDDKYYELKHEELLLTHEYEMAKQEQKEIERERRERIREEEKAEREIQKAIKDSEKEEALKLKALDQARKELADEHGKHNEKLAELVVKLEIELQDALDRKAKAIARAQLTRSGHVYVLSNIGTFGEGVYKIGMTRRLEPLERVRELGGASVPFPFDVHAMIYSEDAPALENALHKHFATRRVNLVNLRREFFRVTLDEIRDAVAEHYGLVTFVLEPEAEQYRDTMALLAEGQSVVEVA